MKVVVVSKNRELYALCVEVVTELMSTESVLMADSALGTSANDICLWDFQPGETELPDRIEPSRLRNSYFLLQRKHLGALRQHFGIIEVNTILKPVTRATLRAFLSDTCHRWKKEHRGEEQHVNTARAERDDILQSLIEANLKLQEYDHERTNFLARAIHDFRAPLTALGGYCGLMLGEQFGSISTEQKEVLERMLHSAKRLTRMANAMFQLSICQRVEGRLNLQKEDIRECIEQALHEVTPFTEGKRISISVDVIPPPESLTFERGQLEQVLINLLDNACKFTPRAGSIEIRGYPFFWERRTAQIPSRGGDRRLRQLSEPNSFRVDVRDSGPPVPAGHLNKIFEEYTSYAGGQDRSGGGLGLAICKMLMHQHQGRIWAEPTSAGALFSLVLPFQRTEPAILSEQEIFQQVAYAI
jgi:signal transduction histidine kinase